MTEGVRAVTQGLARDLAFLGNAEDARVLAHRFAEQFELTDEERAATLAEVEAFIRANRLPEPPDPLAYLRRLAGELWFDAICEREVGHRIEVVATARPEEIGELDGAPPQPVGTVGDAELLDRIRRSKAAADFDALWRGDWNGHPSASEADYELLRILCWFGASEAQAERLWLQSALGRREKVQKREDYRKRTIRRAAEVVATARWRVAQSAESGALARIPDADDVLAKWR